MQQLQSKYNDQGPERCGFVLTDGEIVETPNVAVDPINGFMIDPFQILEHEERLTATWHTHPNADANLSVDDFIMFKNWPDLDHYVIGRDGTRKFKVNKGTVVEA
jgi:proteasome lid subunit RPN8/RPN11